MGEACKVMEELFSLPVDEISNDANENGWVYMGSTSFATKLGAHLWRDNLKHTCHPLEQSMQNWPQNPKRYRDVMGVYIVEIRRLSLRILELISQGLGLEKGYLEEMSRVQFLTASNYPACPDPSLTLGILKHFDHSLITILFQGSCGGLQVLKGDKWIGVEVVPNAFVVNIGTQIEIISNGKLRSAQHRVVTSKEGSRTSIASFINPSPDCIIEPAKVLVNESNPPLYQPTTFKDFVKAFKPFGPFTNLVQHDSRANPLHPGENDADEIALAYLDKYDPLRPLL
ncbi:2-oxoglutarate (2OG) and Fe(II)-dependent oxygenase superfamily protein [Striga asiatica]|uniref:2-oxoglutarate (2OG) and Fe(II)-dependent oxygenase superfamily protein n=1 Tax=Striga asiatica TaxID=4170 RepID=A0A5A7NWT0_STRAF|nr:2-oxoglutarate (2OG) and Fe(II)-dependent oxygenase superfamily protein [Striga asiatica]